MWDHTYSRTYAKELENLRYEVDESEYIKDVEKHLENGGEIDVRINNSFERDGTILLRSVRYGCSRIAEYALKKGANIANKMEVSTSFMGFDDYSSSRWTWNALEISILGLKKRDSCRSPNNDVNRVYEYVKNESLEKYTSFGLHQLHIECAKGDWSEIVKCLEFEPDLVNKRIVVESPVWPGMTPLLIAVKFYKLDLITKLVELGASPRARDADGNTPASILCEYKLYLRPYSQPHYEKLFVFFEEETFNHENISDVSHFFRIACEMCPKTLDIVKTYLRQGVSPNLQMEGTTPLNVSVGNLKANSKVMYFSPRCRSDLIRLLIDYGADVNQKTIHGLTAFKIYYFFDHEETNRQLIVPFIEAGVSLDCIDLDKLCNYIIAKADLKYDVLRCVIKLSVLDKNLVTPKLKNLYEKLLLASPYFDEEDYADYCLRELDWLETRSLRREIFDKTITDCEFKKRFENLIDSSNLCKLYPIYGQLLKIKIRKRLLEIEKKEIIKNAIPQLQFLAKAYCNLPDICCEEILQNFEVFDLKCFMRIIERSINRMR